MLKFAPGIAEEIIAHARADAPIEVCGYLARQGEVVVKVVRLTNADASPEHFSLIPAEQFQAVKAMRAEGLTLAAVYHSHPASPARMSEEDIRLAVDKTLSYVIVSLAGAEPVIKSFRVENGVAEEPIEPAFQEER